MTNTENLDIILESIKAERLFQETCYGTRNKAHTSDDWFRILAKQFGQVCEAHADIIDHNESMKEAELKSNLIQTAAVCVAWLEFLEEAVND